MLNTSSTARPLIIALTLLGPTSFTRLKCPTTSGIWFSIFTSKFSCELSLRWHGGNCSRDAVYRALGGWRRIWLGSLAGISQSIVWVPNRRLRARPRKGIIPSQLFVNSTPSEVHTAIKIPHVWRRSGVDQALDIHRLLFVLVLVGSVLYRSTSPGLFPILTC